MKIVKENPMIGQMIADADTAFPDILTLLRQKALETPDAIALEDHTGVLETYRSLFDCMEHLASEMISRGIATPSETRRIGLVLPNGPDMSKALLASACVGTSIPLNPAYTAAEFEDYYHELQISSLITSEGVSEHARQVAERLGIPVFSYEELSKRTDAAIESIAPPQPSDVAMILLTSGSTGRCKKVPLTHRNVCTSARDVCRSLLLTPSDRCLSMWELFHIGGLVDLLLAPLHSGGTVISTSGFATDLFFDLLEKKKPTWFQGVPTALGELLTMAKRKQINPAGSSLRFLRSVAAALPPARMLELETLFGVPVIQTFGMTEGGPLITSTPLPPAVRKPGSVGISCGAEVGVFSADGQRIIDGSSGELAIRGDNVFSGYEGDSAANAAAFFDGWFRTGDLGRIDEDGHLFLTGRIKELINRGGEKVNPSEVDSALLTHPAVLEAASFAEAHRTLGEDVAAAVVLKNGFSADEQELRKYLLHHLTTFKIPQRILFLQSLPRNAVGKIDRMALAAIAEQEVAPALGFEGKLSEVEARIAAIWATELNLPQVSPIENFFRLGGDSLSGLRMFLAVESAFSLKLTADALTNIRTVRELADRLTKEGVSYEMTFRQGEGMLSEAEQRQILTVMEMGEIPTLRPGSAIKVLNPKGNRPPFIWCFNVPALEMRIISRFIHPEQPVYGIFSGGRLLDRSDEKLTELSRYYMAELLEVFPTGSFHLGGNCQGGIIACMLAQMLEDAGRKVESLMGHEFCRDSLTSFKGRLLLMFPKYERRRFYERIRWGEPDWEKPFAIKPIVCWVNGSHRGFLPDDGALNLITNIESFLRGEDKIEGTIDSIRGRTIWWIRRIPTLFEIYRRYCKLVSYLRYGKKKKFHPFSEEEIHKSSRFQRKSQTK